MRHELLHEDENQRGRKEAEEAERGGKARHLIGAGFSGSQLKRNVK